MSIKVAQHHAQVVGIPEQSGVLNVSRIYADVLISNIDPEAQITSSTMSLVSDATYQSLTRQVSPSSTMNLTGVSAGVKDRFISASNALTLVSLGGRALPSTANNILYLANLVGAINAVGDRAPAGNSLNLSQSVLSLSSIEVIQNLGLLQSLSIQFPTKITIEQPLGVSQATSTPHRAFIDDPMVIVQSVSIPLSTQLVTSTLNITDTIPNGVVSTEILFTQQASFGYGHNISHDLGVTQNLHLEGIWIRTPSHTDFLGHALTWHEDTPCGRKQYTPFQGETSVPNTTTIPPSDTLQDPQGDTGNFSLSQPYLGTPLKKVTLRKPEMDNRDRNANERISEETRGGDLIVYADPDWPKIRTLAVTIVGLTETKVDELQTFLQATVGEEIGINDWEGRLWKGFVTNPNESATQDGRDRWTVTFEFQGELLDVWQAGDTGDDEAMVMNITQEVTAVIV